MGLTPLDDYPVHQTPLPITQPGGGHPNFYDRYFFNAYDPDGAFYVALALGVYPNRRIIDAAFSVVVDGVQHSLFASDRAPADRRETRVGPIELEIVEPLAANRIAVDGEGFRADLTWKPRTVAVAEPRQTLYDGEVPMLDSTRLVQWGSWQGTVSVGDDLHIGVGATSRGTKDRSWGVRPIGDSVTSAPSGQLPGLVFFWGPVNFESECTHVMLFEGPDGARRSESCFTVDTLAAGQPSWGDTGRVRHGHHPRYSLRWRPGTRRSETSTWSWDHHDGSSVELTYEPMLDFQMRGIGYTHPTYGHGRWHGGPSVATETLTLAELDPLAFPNVHVQQLCRVTRGSEQGVGILEQLAIGPHAPTGLKELLDGG